MATPRARGACSNCRQPNAYTGYTCDFCGDRLLWADSFVATSGEACPHCQEFNAYDKSACARCERELPWSESPAARKARAGTAESEQKSLAVTVVFFAILFVVVCGILFSM